MEKLIPFNKPYLSGNETHYIKQAAEALKLSGDGMFTKKCHQFFEKRYGFLKCLLTTSCTDALEMASLLLDIKPGDEVIIPSFTFVSTANAFVLRGAHIVFADVEANTGNLDMTKLEPLINSKTRAVVPVHYAGVACDMDTLNTLSKKHNFFIIEDAAQAIDSFYRGKPLGSLGTMSAFSFHETKNIISGEGGMLAINDSRFINRAEIIREKGTNRSQFFRGEVDKYGWVDVGSSFLPSEIIAAFLYAQLEQLDNIQEKRKKLWNIYLEELSQLKDQISLPYIPDYATNNAHMFYIRCKSLDERSALIQHLKKKGITAVFHYLSLHRSPFYTSKHDQRQLPVSDHLSDTLLRLPLFFELGEDEVQYICNEIKAFYSA